MGFEESVLARMRRYREEADRSLTVQREVEETARRFSERLFAGLERTGRRSDGRPGSGLRSKERRVF